MIEKRINGKENDSIQARTDSERQNTDGHRPTKDGRTWTDKHGQTRTDKHGRTWADKTPDKHERTRTENTRVLSVRVCVFVCPHLNMPQVKRVELNEEEKTDHYL